MRVDLTEPEPVVAGRAPRRRRRLVAGALLAAALAAAAFLLLGRDRAPRPAKRTSAGGTVAVARRTLVQHSSESGTLDYAGKRSAFSRLSGTITWLPRAGQVVRRGGRLFDVDGRPVLLMYGSQPAYRALAQGVHRGEDVRELEQNLTALGYTAGEQMTVDDRFTAATATALKDWQHAVGMRVTGKLQLGRVAFLPGARRVGALKVSLGSTAAASTGSDEPRMRFVDAPAMDGTQLPDTGDDRSKPKKPHKPKKKPHKPRQRRNTPTKPASDGGSTPTGDSGTPGGSNPDSGNGGNGGSAPSVEVMETTSLRRVVTVQLDATKQTLARRGAKVTVDLPNGSTVRGRVATVGKVAVSSGGGGGDPAGGDSGTPKITVTIRLSSRRRGGSLDKAPVAVQFAKVTRRHVLAVPVTALVATAGGGYAVEVGSGRSKRQIPVTPGLFANGYVEIEGAGIHTGLRVRNATG